MPSHGWWVALVDIRDLGPDESFVEVPADVLGFVSRVS
jgi:hypothetical protein